MQMSGSVRRTHEKPGRFAHSWQSPPLALANGTALPGPDAHHSGPGYFLQAVRLRFCLVPKSIPDSMPTSYFIPLERKSHSGAMRSEFYE